MLITMKLMLSLIPAKEAHLATEITTKIVLGLTECFS